VLQPTEWTRNGRDVPEGCETVTIVFDAEHKLSIQLGISAGVQEAKLQWGHSILSRALLSSTEML
jgi:hypothetical protein